MSNAEIALELLPKLKTELGDSADGVSDDHLIKFLLWKPTVKRAAERFLLLQKWMEENPWAFEKPLGEDPALQRLLEGEVLVAPEGMVDKEGRQVLMGRLRFNDMSDGRTPKDVVRMLLYTIDQAVQRKEAQDNGVIIFHDMTGISRNNMDTGIPKLMFNAIIGHFPLRIHGIFIYNAPWFVKSMFSMISLMMPAKLRKRVKFVDDLSELPIEKDELLVEHGGKRSHDQGAWIQDQLQKEKDGTFTTLKDCQIQK